MSVFPAPVEEDVHPAAVAAVAATTSEWARIVAAGIAPLRVEAPGDALRARLRVKRVRSSTLALVEAGPHAVGQTDDRGSGSRWCKLSFQLEGECTLEQGGMRTVIRPGQFAIYASDRPYELGFAGPTASLALLFPRSILSVGDAAFDSIAVRAIDGQRGIGRFVTPLLAEITRHIDEIDGPAAPRLVDGVLDMIAAGVLSDVGGIPASSHADLLERMLAYVDAHLADPDLTPRSIASAHYISVRHLHNVFHERNITVAAWIRRRRLEECRRDLAHAGADVSITATALAYGFTDPTHFSRLFRAAYGMSPRAYRGTVGAAA